MTHTFADALPVILREEGGFVNDALDPGGMTNLGVTEASWSAWIGHAANEAIMRGLTPDQVSPFYRVDYWDKVAGDQLPDGVNLAVFDFAVNHGPHGAAQTLQGIVGASADGMIGPGTLSAVAGYVGEYGAVALVKAYTAARTRYYQSLPTFARFGRGWINRDGYIEGVALSWVG